MTAGGRASICLTKRWSRRDYEQRSRDDRAAFDSMPKPVNGSSIWPSGSPAIWNDLRVEPRERKRLLRLLVEDVTLIKAEVVIDRRLSASSAWNHGGRYDADTNLS